MKWIIRLVDVAMFKSIFSESFHNESLFYLSLFDAHLYTYSHTHCVSTFYNTVNPRSVCTYMYHANGMHYMYIVHACVFSAGSWKITLGLE